MLEWSSLHPANPARAARGFHPGLPAVSMANVAASRDNAIHSDTVSPSRGFTPGR